MLSRRQMRAVALVASGIAAVARPARAEEVRREGSRARSASTPAAFAHFLRVAGGGAYSLRQSEPFL